MYDDPEIMNDAEVKIALGLSMADWYLDRAIRYETLEELTIANAFFEEALKLDKELDEETSWP